MAAITRVTQLTSSDVMIDVTGESYEEAIAAVVDAAGGYPGKRVATFSHVSVDIPSTCHYMVMVLTT